MTIGAISASGLGPISASGLSQYVLSTSHSSQLQQVLKTLQSSLASGDQNGARSAFQALQKLFENAATASGGSLSSGSQLSTDMTALGSALDAGDVTKAQTAFGTVQTDVKQGLSPLQTNETNAAAQSVQLVGELLSSLNSSSASSSTSDTTTSVLEKVYGSRGGVNVFG